MKIHGLPLTLVRCTLSFSARLNLNIRTDTNPHTRERNTKFALCFGSTIPEPPLSIPESDHYLHGRVFPRIVKSIGTGHRLWHPRFPTRSGDSGPHRRRAYQRVETFGATSSTRWTLRYAQNLPIRIRQIGFRVHVHFVNPTFHLLVALNVLAVMKMKVVGV